MSALFSRLKGLFRRRPNLDDWVTEYNRSHVCSPIVKALPYALGDLQLSQLKNGVAVKNGADELWVFEYDTFCKVLDGLQKQGQRPE